MKKIFIISEATLDIDFSGNRPVAASPGGVLLRVAAILGSDPACAAPVAMISELSRDAVGDIVVNYLTTNNVDTHSIDRYCDGSTPIAINIEGSPSVKYKNDPPEGFDVVWPRIDPGDVVVYGGVMAISDRCRRQITELLEYAADRRATKVYVPTLTAADVPRVTRAMPAIIDNLEVADYVVISPEETRLLWGLDDASRCYRDHIRFYGPKTVVLDPASGSAMLHTSADTTPIVTGAQNAEDLIAGVIASL